MENVAAAYRLRALLVLMIVVLLLGACGGSPNQTISNASGTPITQSRADFQVGGKILFVKGGTIYSWSNGTTKSLTPPGRVFESPSWSPDGRKIAAIEKGTNHSDLMILNADGKPEKQLTRNLSNASIQSSAWARRPVWSPDGTKIAYVTDLGTDKLALWITDLEGISRRRANYQPLGNGDVDSPSWSKDGKRIAFTAWWDNQSQLYVLDVGTGAVKKLTDHREGIYDAAWSPDGSRIAYTKRSNGKHDLWAVDSNGGGEIRLTGLGTARFPAWSPDGQIVAFVADLGQGFDLYAVKVGMVSSGSAVPSEAKQLTAGQKIDAAAGISWTK